MHNGCGSHGGEISNWETIINHPDRVCRVTHLTKLTESKRARSISVGDFPCHAVLAATLSALFNDSCNKLRALFCFWILLCTCFVVTISYGAIKWMNSVWNEGLSRNNVEWQRNKFQYCRLFRLIIKSCFVFISIRLFCAYSTSFNYYN